MLTDLNLTVLELSDKDKENLERYEYAWLIFEVDRFKVYFSDFSGQFWIHDTEMPDQIFVLTPSECEEDPNTQWDLVIRDALVKQLEEEAIEEAIQTVLF